MRITIEYEASWQNSFLDGSNNEILPKNGRGFIGSMTNLSKRNPEGNYPNFIKRKVSHDTVMGVLNRLIGDQRKLYQARQCPKYYFSTLESCISYENIESKLVMNKEIVFIRNMMGSTDQNSFTGMIKNNDPIFSSEYSNAFWGVLTLDFEKLCQFIINPDFVVINDNVFNPMETLECLDKLNKLKAVSITEDVQNALDVLQQNFPDAKYLDAKGMIKPIMFYCSSLYLQISRLGKNFDLSGALTKSGLISGISKQGVTVKNFMDRFTTGRQKLIWGNPYLLKEKRKGEYEVTSMLTKANGVLEITLNITQEKALELNDMINAAAVSSFYLGKKGLAYVSGIRI